MNEQEIINTKDIEFIKEALVRIEAQTTKTNGRVSGLETFRTQVLTYGSIAILVVPYLISKIL